MSRADSGGDGPRVPGSKAPAAGGAPLLPEEIAAKTFSVSTRGYDRGEVESFLLKVAADYGAAIDKALALSRVRSDPCGELGQDVAAILDAAAEAGLEIKTHAQKQADQLRRRAAEVLLAAEMQAESIEAAARQAAPGGGREKSGGERTRA